MLDRITYSPKHFDLDGLKRRYRRLIRNAVPDKRAPDLLAAMLRRGSLERGKASLALKTSERTARNTLKALSDAGSVRSISPNAPVWTACALDYRERLFPYLFASEEQTA